MGQNRRGFLGTLAALAAIALSRARASSSESVVFESPSGDYGPVKGVVGLDGSKICNVARVYHEVDKKAADIAGHGYRGIMWIRTPDYVEVRALDSIALYGEQRVTVQFGPYGDRTTAAELALHIIRDLSGVPI